MIVWASLQPPQEVFIQGHLEKGCRSAKCQGGAATLDANNWSQHIPRVKVGEKSVTLFQKKAPAQQALPCCLIQEISPKHLR
uniref:Uncharacterized protein n=1 Tax=Sciurus vulgaris TaxID=55149 RepID=A0A8D2AVC1_SCIVU